MENSGHLKSFGLLVGWILFGSSLLHSAEPDSLPAVPVATRKAEPDLLPADTSHGEHHKAGSSGKKKKFNYWQSLFRGHIDRTFEKPFDFTFIVSPSYAQESGLGLGGGIMGHYRVDRTDSALPPSNIALFVSAALRGFYGGNLNGVTYFSDQPGVLSYSFKINRKKLKMWGVDFESCSHNPVIEYKRQEISLEAGYLYSVARHFWVGADYRLAYRNITSIDDVSYLQGDKTRYVFNGMGLTLQYDSRDVATNPKKGFFVMLRGIVYPPFTGTYNKTLYKVYFTADWYQKLWKGATLAADLYGEFGRRNSPWPMKAELGGIYRMRGYYLGRFTDNNLATFQVELRQNIYKRIGCVAWFGAGAVFPRISRLNGRHFKINGGLGFRFEFKHNVNIRIDYGFGKRIGGLAVGINEAF